MTTSQSPRQAPATRPLRRTVDDESPTLFAVRGVILVGFAFFVGGAVGAGAALVGVALTWRRPAGRAAAAAAAMLTLAAFATVLEVRPEPGALRSNFADLRPVASALGLAAGMLALVAVGTAAFRERATQPKAQPDRRELHGLAWLRQMLSKDKALQLAPYAGLVLLAGLLRAVAKPDPLPGDLDQLTMNLRNGAGYVLGTSAPFEPTGGPSPVPAILGAFAPGGASVSLVLASMVAVGAAIAFGHALMGRRVALVTGGAALLSLIITAQALGPTVATACLFLAALAALTPGRTQGRSALCGLLFGIAVLSTPWALLAAPFLAFSMGSRRSPFPEPRRRDAIVALAVAFLTCAPWQRYLLAEFDTWAPSTDMALSLATLGVVLTLAIIAAVPLLGPRLDRPRAIG